MLLRVIISPNNITKLRLQDLPHSVQSLKEILQDQLKLKEGFILQYEDPEFGNQLCNLTDISEIPPEKTTLRVLYEASPDPDEADLSLSSLDTASLPSSSNSPRTSVGPSPGRRSSLWPSPFPVPNFSYDVELRLQKGNDVYKDRGTLLNITRDIKSEVLDKIAQAVFEVTAYPDRSEIDSVAMALVNKHPCLREPGSGNGWNGWRMSIAFKIGNYRQKLRNAGCEEVKVNERRGSHEEGWPGLKKAKRAEVNFLPDHPAGQSEDTLEKDREALTVEMEKRNPDMTFINAAMDRTFSLRRKEIIDQEPHVDLVKHRWPALFMEYQVNCEFQRITMVALQRTFLKALETHTPKLLKMYRTRTAHFGEEMQTLLDSLDKETSDISEHRRTVALRGLPLFVRDYGAERILRTCLNTDPEEAYTKDVRMAVLTVVEDDGGAGASASPHIEDFAIVLEENVVIHNIRNFPNAFALFFGLLYALNFQYPKELKYTCEVIQKVFLSLGDDCSARVQSFKNKLLR
ncbi:Sterile alpha motif domain-containing protein 3 [Merluccius polli]|uniref:Sterile alpha motif domain-containing protein 3 n=1 Tax=Merluccius polli TaxID=89951 RepID=A0AA47MD16_MERPO|nr:Sterile alpha motif domain-containing protein 3 [Merluccius polli]